MTDADVTYERPPAATDSLAVQVRGLRMSCGLTVAAPSLEDTYLQLTGTATDAVSAEGDQS